MLYLLLFASVLSEEITDANAALFFSLIDHSPVLAILVSDWCPHCVDMMPTFQILEEKYNKSELVTIARINCDRSKSICSRFPERSTPGIYWVLTTPEQSEAYHGAVDYENLNNYIEKQVSPQLIQIFNESHFHIEINRHNSSSIFIFQAPSTTNNVDIIKGIAIQFKSYPCRFFEIMYDKYPEKETVLAQYDPYADKYQFMQGIFTERSVYEFISMISFPRFVPVSQLFFSHFQATNQTVLILADEAPFFESSLVSIIPKLPNVCCGMLYCGNHPKLCLSLLIPTNRGPQFIMLNSSLQYRWQFKDPLTEENIIMWTKAVLNGEIAPSGTGAGFIGFIRELLDNSRRSGIIPFILLVTAGSILILTCVLGTADSYRMRRRRMHYHKMS